MLIEHRTSDKDNQSQLTTRITTHSTRRLNSNSFIRFGYLSQTLARGCYCTGTAAMIGKGEEMVRAADYEGRACSTKRCLSTF